MKKLLLMVVPIAVIAGCSGNNSEDAPAPKGTMPNVQEAPPGMTGPGQRAAGPGGAPEIAGEGSR